MTDQCQAGDNGDCQHVHLEGRLRTIPFGTHIIGGRTVSVSGSSGDQATSRQSDDTLKDSLAEDLLEILGRSKMLLGWGARRINTNEVATFEQVLMPPLLGYIIDRDHKILNHGINVGRKQK